MGRNPFRVVVIYMSPLYAQSMDSKSINHFGYLPRESVELKSLLCTQLIGRCIHRNFQMNRLSTSGDIDSGRRIRDGSGRNTPEVTEHGSSIPTGKFLDFFRCIPITFLRFPARNWSEIIGKNPEIFRPEYCFHVPMISGVFLQYPAFFPPLSYRFLRDQVTRIFDLGKIKNRSSLFK